MKLLTRQEFRELCLDRDNYKCVICECKDSLSVHHIIERRLWVAEHEFGGYFELNGASLCSEHHIAAEQTTLSCDDIRQAAGITKILHPEQFYDDVELDKWGNYIQPNGTRLRGELFYDESVQKILKDGGVLPLFVDYVKYPRTFHLPWSNPSKDDKVISNLNSFIDQDVVVSLKMDGENSNLYRDHFHARSLEFATGADRGWVKMLHASIAHDIPNGWRFVGENVYAEHSIHYTGLESYFYLFSIWNERNECLSWDETLEWAELLGLKTVPILYRGIWDENLIRNLYQINYNGNEMEGYVVRVTSRFTYGDFKKCVGKFVRKGHVQPNAFHWRQKVIIPNELA